MSKQGVNTVTIIGNVGKDPELRYFNDGTGVCNLSIATSESWNDKQTGEKREKTEWHRCVFRDRGNYKMGQYASEITKGEKLYIEGSLHTREWDKDGQKHYTTEIIVQEFQRLSPRPQQGAGYPQGQGAPVAAPQAAPQQFQQHGQAPVHQPAPPPQGQPQGAYQQPVAAPQQYSQAPQGQPPQQAPIAPGGFGDLEDIPFS